MFLRKNLSHRHVPLGLRGESRPPHLCLRITSFQAVSPARRELDKCLQSWAIDSSRKEALHIPILKLLQSCQGEKVAGLFSPEDRMRTHCLEFREKQLPLYIRKYFLITGVSRNPVYCLLWQNESESSKTPWSSNWMFPGLQIRWEQLFKDLVPKNDAKYLNFYIGCMS